ncbi:hypothetical protein C1I95_12515 [Micromonospora craterilacus]|uniref:Uncharacterized protein n=1 Tax=Micromonospora craterilacus TaxID=1655439 RepID=A0A2W2E8X3_9ACTN|nr:hypothetical protein C1I95_12515 [Micromonospora craterilacus]
MSTRVLPAASWWQTLAEHRPAGGWCPQCGKRKCWPRAEAFGQLVAHDLWHLGPQIHGGVDDGADRAETRRVDAGRR